MSNGEDRAKKRLADLRRRRREIGEQFVRAESPVDQLHFRRQMQALDRAIEGFSGPEPDPRVAQDELEARRRRARSPVPQEVLTRAAAVLQQGVPKDMVATPHPTIMRDEENRKWFKRAEKENVKRLRAQRRVLGERARVIGQQQAAIAPSATAVDVPPIRPRRPPEMRAQPGTETRFGEEMRETAQMVEQEKLDRVRAELDRVIGILPRGMRGPLAFALQGTAQITEDFLPTIARFIPEGKVRESAERAAETAKTVGEVGEGFTEGLGEFAGVVLPFIGTYETLGLPLARAVATTTAKTGLPRFFLHPRFLQGTAVAAAEFPLGLAKGFAEVETADDVLQLGLTEGVKAAAVGVVGAIVPSFLIDPRLKPTISPTVIGLEAAAEEMKRRANLPLRMFKGRLEHWSQNGQLTHLDPEFFGAGRATAQDAATSIGGPRPGYTYIAGTPPESALAGRAPHKYVSEELAIPVYDIGTDPDNLVAGFTAAHRSRGATRYREGPPPTQGQLNQFLFDMGYDGVRNSTHPDASLKNAVMLFRGVRFGTGVEDKATRDLFRARVSGLMGQREIDRVAQELGRRADVLRGLEELQFFQAQAQRAYDAETRGIIASIKDATVETYGKIAQVVRRDGLGGALRNVARQLNEAGFARIGGRRRPSGLPEFPATPATADWNMAGAQGAWIAHGEGHAIGSAAWRSRLVDAYGSDILQHVPRIEKETKKYIAGVLKHTVDNELPSLRKMMDLAKQGEDISQWYNATREEFSRMFGQEDGDLWMGLLAATSANNLVDANVTLAQKLFNIIRFEDRWPTAADGVMAHHLGNVLRYLRGEPLNGPKIGPYHRALMGDENAIVADTWMQRAFGFKTVTAEGKKRTIGSRERQYVEAAVRRVAEQMGTTNREAQAAIWVGFKRSVGDTGPVMPYEIVLRNQLRQRGFAEAEDLTEALTQHDWVVLSAQKTGMTPSAASKANDELATVIRQMGYTPVRAKGGYVSGTQDVIEDSFLVPGLTETEAVILGKRFGQESILTQRGFIFTDDAGFGRMVPLSDRNPIVWQGAITRESPFHPANRAAHGIGGWTKVEFGGRVHHFAHRADFDVSVPAFPNIAPTPGAAAGGLETIELAKPLAQHSDTELITLLQRATGQQARFDAARREALEEGAEFIGNLNAAAFDIQQIRREIWKRNGVVIRQAEDIIGEAGKASPELLGLLSASGSGAAVGAVGGAALADDPLEGAIAGAVIGGAGAAALFRVGKAGLGRLTRGLAEPRARAPKAPTLPKPKMTQPEIPVEDLINVSKMDIHPAVFDPTASNVLKGEIKRAAMARDLSFKETVTREQTMARARDFAQRYGLDPNAIRPSAGRLSGEEMVAIENVVSRNTNELVKFGNMLKNPTELSHADLQIIEANMAGLREQNNHLLGMLMEARTAAGRDLNSLKYLANRNFEDVDFWVVQARNMLGNSPEPATLHADLASFISAGDRNGLVAYIQGLKRSPLDDKMVALWKAGLLSAPPTHMANTVGNLTMHALESVKDAPAFVYDAILRTMLGNTVVTKPGLTRLAAGQRASMRGALLGLQEALHVTGLRNFGREIKAALQAENVHQFFGGLGEAFGQLRGQPLANAMSKYDMQRVTNFDNAFFDIYTKLVFNALGGMDRFFRQIAQARSLEMQAWAMAEEHALRAGLRRGTRQWNEVVRARANEFAQQPTSAMHLTAIADSEVAIFLNNSRLAQAAAGIKRPFGAAAEPVIPFAKTPANIATMVVEYSPLSLGSVIWNTLKLAFKSLPEAEARALQKATAERFGRSATGTTIAGIGYYLASRGLMTGNIPRSRTEREQWDHEGRMPNAILADGKWRSVERLSPLGNLLALGANAYWIFADESDKTGAERLEESVVSIGRTVTEQSFLRGLNTFTAVIQGERPVRSFTQQLAGSVVPTVFSRAARVVDPVRRKPTNLIEAAMARFPYLSRMVPARINQFGGEQEWHQGPIAAFFDLLYSRPDMTKRDDVLAEMRRVEAHVGVPQQKDDELDEDYQARMIAYGKEWERHLRFVVESDKYKQIPEQARRQAERLGWNEEDARGLGVEMQRYTIEAEANWVRQKLDQLGTLGPAHTRDSRERIHNRTRDRVRTLNEELERKEKK